MELLALLVLSPLLAAGILPAGGDDETSDADQDTDDAEPVFQTSDTVERSPENDLLQWSQEQNNREDRSGPPPPAKNGPQNEFTKNPTDTPTSTYAVLTSYEGPQQLDRLNEGGRGAQTVERSMSVIDTTDTGEIVTDRHFGGNTVFVANTDQGEPTAEYTAAVEELGINHFRFPGGQGDPSVGLIDGEEWLNVVTMEPNDQGEMDLRPELKAMLEWAEEQEDGKVTLVLPTRIWDADEYEAYVESELPDFVSKLMTDHGDVIEAFEIGNEYWATMGETEYGIKANHAVTALSKALAAEGIEQEDQPDILVQMAKPTGQSDFHGSKDSRGFIARLEDANQAIIDEIGSEARTAVDGVVEHYYYRQSNLEFEDSGLERSFINRQYDIWDNAFDQDLDRHITEWSIRNSNYDENGMRSASVILEQFENMQEMGVDGAHVWPVKHNTANDIAGGKEEPIELDDEGRLVNTIRGAIFDRMSNDLVGMELIKTDFSNDDGSVEINTYQSDDKTVVFVSSRSFDVMDLEVDLSELVEEFSSAIGMKLGIDPSKDSSNGNHWRSDTGRSPASSLTLDGEDYYYDEHDVRAQFTDYTFESSTIGMQLKPFEVMELIFHK